MRRSTDEDEGIELHGEVVPKMKLVRHLVLSACFGFAAAVVLSSILYLNVTNHIFALLYAGTIGITGVGLVWRAQLQRTHNSPSMNLVAMSGGLVTSICCLTTVLVSRTQSWVAYVELVLYSISSIGSMYALAFVSTDIFNRISRNGAELTAHQLYSLAAASVIIGASAGFFFALVDVEQHAARFGYEQWISAAIGGVGGLLVGYVNFFAKDESLKITFEPLPMDDFTPTHDFDVDN